VYTTVKRFFLSFLKQSLSQNVLSFPGMEQMQLGFGADDEEKWRQYYSTVFDVPKKIKKMSMRDNNLFPPDQVCIKFNAVPAA
jgi:hypothetical protein